MIHYTSSTATALSVDAHNFFLDFCFILPSPDTAYYKIHTVPKQPSILPPKSSF